MTSKQTQQRRKLLFTDTDSLTYEIEIEDVSKDLWSDENKFDSEYPEYSWYFDKTNKEVISKFKDEASSMPITEFPCVVLVSRSYFESTPYQKMSVLGS